MRVKVLQWNEPNRRNTPPLHIASRGDRISTLTGVAWLDENRLIVNHRSGLRLALFDLARGSTPVTIAEIPHLTDDVAAKQIGPESWEIAVSGCWDASYSLFRLEGGIDPKFYRLVTSPAPDKTFCHGVAYDGHGRLCLAFHTGVDPRIEIGGEVSRLPAPWGARDVCYDASSDRYFAVAVSNNPKREAYEQTGTSVWTYRSSEGRWDMLLHVNKMHSDACQVHKKRIWLPDQKGDRVLALCLAKERPPLVLQGKCFDFPHGLAVSDGGMLAVSNYGNSTIALIDIRDTPG